MQHDHFRDGIIGLKGCRTSGANEAEVPLSALWVSADVACQVTADDMFLTVCPVSLKPVTWLRTHAQHQSDVSSDDLSYMKHNFTLHDTAN